MGNTFKSTPFSALSICKNLTSRISLKGTIIKSFKCLKNYFGKIIMLQSFAMLFFLISHAEILLTGQVCREFSKC